MLVPLNPIGFSRPRNESRPLRLMFAPKVKSGTHDRGETAQEDHLRRRCVQAFAGCVRFVMRIIIATSSHDRRDRWVDDVRLSDLEPRFVARLAASVAPSKTRLLSAIR